LLRDRVLLHAPELIGHLLIAVLQLLDDAGHLPDLGFETIDAHVQIAGGGLSEPIAMGSRLTATEQTIEEAGRFVCSGLTPGGLT
jgi:hypothetical protein